ncbi:MAG: endonuclease MutS2 [Lachnospiraceae bacterium]|nr:endonuclease MutS2 [Lachnospiraceae bacterium]HCJ06960.1 endonuclease MutS2 [Lachnospiraceae bacterium]
MNKRTLRVLEYYKIIEKLTGFATCPAGKRMCERLKPSTDLMEITKNQEETADALRRVYQQGSLSFSGVYPIGEAMKRVAVGASLSSAELLDVAKLLQVAEHARQYGEQSQDKDEEGVNTRQDSLTGYFESLMPLEHLAREINRCILSEDEIADDASATLKDIRRNMKATNGKVHEVLNGIVTRQTNQAMLQDTIVTMRNGRYCIPVKSEYKGQFPGMVHDQSSTGSTFFIEPMAVVNLNNELKELAAKEAMEIEKILARLSEQVAQSKDALESNVEVLTKLDFIFAKASFAKSYDGTEPELNTNGYTNLKQARHPLLERHSVVPVDIRLGDDYTMLIITGPNTGGKTVSLKTLGLLTLMGQSGLHIPAFQGSTLAVFEDVFADIGDEQSIEQNLSTFSSHMTNVVYILKHASSRCLVLFDELGGGTDPVEGSALAISILNDLHNRDIRCMATTHYSELKTFAMTTPGIENACCEFDVETLSPTYHLLIGIPGKSNAFAIAKKLGMADHVIESAKSQIDSSTVDMEALLADLEKSKRTIEQEQAEIAANKEEIQKLKDRLASKNEHIEQRKQDILRNAREEAREILEDAKAFADESIRKYNNWEKKPQTANNKDMEKARGELRDKLKSVNSKLEYKTSNRKSKAKASDFHLGDSVHVISLNLDGTVRSLPNQKGELTVQMGILQSTVKISDVEIVKEEKQSKQQKTAQYRASVNKAKNIKPEINLLGMTVDEAIMELDKYLDDACLSHLNQVRIVHGKGTGALRKGVHEYLKRQKYVKSFRLGEFGEGDAGVTIVEL